MLLYILTVLCLINSVFCGCLETDCKQNSGTFECGTYNLIENSRKSCANGTIYTCCENSSSSVAAAVERISNNDAINSVSEVPYACWDTGCQLDVWAIKGCAQYGMTETGQKSCSGGKIYSCCGKYSKPTPGPIPIQSVNSTSVTCWDTGCQLNSWAVRGCAQYSMIETGQKACVDGIIYTCCSNSSNTALRTTFDQASPTTAGCWDTGCQLDSWAVRGCAQYNRFETNQKPCPGGLIYTCCSNTSSSVPNSAYKTCWDTGCQLNTWATRGCAQYGMVETGQKPCAGGVIYSCCSNSSNPVIVPPSSSLPEFPSVTCWETGCQLDAWAIRGCTQYGMNETGQKPCPGGIIYSCCGNVSNAAVSSSTISCWDTGCQLNSWAIKGCAQYGRVETGRKECANGVIYTCCESYPNSPPVIEVSNLKIGSKQNGYLTHYKFGFTACGRVYSDDDPVAALASSYFTSDIPQEDPLCGKQVKITESTSGNSLIVTIVDRCKACKENDIYVSSAIFKQLGRIPVSWSLI